MKKIYIMMMLVLTGAMAMAQTSVWHGGRAVWTRGAGTEGNPILIESADNLAYLAYVVNKGYDTKDLYFKLTTDVDLNGSEDLQWVPIGLGDRWFSEDGCDRGRPSGSGFYPHTSFLGHFDGGEHSISNIYIDNSERLYGDYAGLFGCAEGVREGSVTYPAVIENVFVTSGFVKGNCCGGIVANGQNSTSVYRCWNGATIVGTNAEWQNYGSGGIIGTNAYEIIKCYNKGDVSGYAVGGIVGTGGAYLIEECYNEGNVSGTYSGGIFGSGKLYGTVVINNCYNKGIISAEGSVPGSMPAGPAAGGIMSFIFQARNSAVSNCYNVGTVTSTSEAGCIVAYAPGVTQENNYFINTCNAGGEGEAQTEEFMQSQAFVDLLNSGNTEPVWLFDENHINDGFPILSANTLAVEEHPKTVFNVYPNPAQGRFTIEGFGQMTITNVLGQMVMTKDIDGKETVELPQGMFFVSLNGSTQKIVVE